MFIPQVLPVNFVKPLDRILGWYKQPQSIGRGPLKCSVSSLTAIGREKLAFLVYSILYFSSEQSGLQRSHIPL